LTIARGAPHTLDVVALVGKAKMFHLAILTNEGVLHYWNGGDVWSVHPEAAARFVQQADAEATIDVLRKAGLINQTMHVVRVGEID
jgi:hypothetical protein